MQLFSAPFQCFLDLTVFFPAVGQYSKHLKQAEVKLISPKACKSAAYYGDLITKNMICAASPDWSTDSCKVSHELKQGKRGSLKSLEFKNS